MSNLKSAFADARNTSSQFLHRAASARPSAATMAAGNSDPLGLNRQQMGSAAEQLKSFRGRPYSIIRTIANRICGQPVCMATPDADGIPDVRRFNLKHVPVPMRKEVATARPVTSHPLLDALADPNPVMLPWSMMFFTIASLEITGMAFWWLRCPEETETGKWEIWPLPASWVQPTHGDQLYSNWTVNPGGYGREFELTPEQLVYFYYPDPSNPVGALAPMAAMAATVYADQAIEESQRRAFINGCNPGLALQVGRLPDSAGVADTTQRPVLNKEQRAALVNAVKKAYRGVAANEEPLILDGLITDVKKITTTPREMDFLNSGDQTKNRLAQGWGVNPIVMGEMSTNRAESAVADEHFITNVIRPRVEMFSQALTTWVVPRMTPDEKLMAWIELPTAVDLDYELARNLAMYQNAAMSRNEWRAEANLPPLDDGDNAFVGGVLVPVRVAAVPQSRNLPSPGVMRKTVAEFREMADSIGDQLTEALALTIGGLVANMRDAVATYAEQNPETPISEATLEHALPAGEWDDIVRRTVRVPIVRAAMVGAELEWRRHHAMTGRKATPPQPRRLIEAVLNGVRRVLDGKAWNRIIGATRDAIASGLRRVADVLGYSPRGKEAVQAIREEVDDNKVVTVSERLAAPESRAATESGAQAVREFNEGNGVQMEKVWHTERDARVRPAHRDAEGQTVGVSDPFNIAGHPCMYPGDPSLPAELRERCRCRVETKYVRTKSLPSGPPMRCKTVPKLTSKGFRKDGENYAEPLAYPDVRQEYNYDCGPAAVLAACQFFNVGHDNLADVAAALGTTEEDGTPPAAVVKYLERCGLAVNAATERSVPQLLEAAKNGHPTIVLMQGYDLEADQIPQMQGGHYATVIGGDDDTLAIHDPSSGPFKLPVLEFLSRWQDAGDTGEFVHWGVTVGRK